MSSPPSRVRDAVNDIQRWLVSLPNPGEAVVRQAIVLRLLQAAGFDIWNPSEVVPEETNATGNRSDFLIRTPGGKFALEIKGMGVALGPAHYQQAATYAVNEGTRWAIVTNGRVWAAIDEHLPGKWEERVALKLELGQAGETFAGDLATLLDAETWRQDRFGYAVRLLRERQQRRLDEARIHREKQPIVEATQQEFGIASFEKAAAAAVQMGRITEAERDVLLGVQVNVVPVPAPLPKPPAVNPSAAAVETRELHFTYRIKEAEAHAIYRPAEGTWTVLAGSTALNRIMGDGSNAKGLASHRQKLSQTGQLQAVSKTLLRYAQDVAYTSPSMSAVAIAGASRNGWTCWKDAQGHLAEYYRSPDQPD
jgi:predicted type IV restriction endonuclease